MLASKLYRVKLRNASSSPATEHARDECKLKIYSKTWPLNFQALCQRPTENPNLTVSNFVSDAGYFNVGGLDLFLLSAARSPRIPSAEHTIFFPSLVSHQTSLP